MLSLENILIRNFNEGMLGVRLKKLTYQQWKKDYPSLYKVIIKSMRDAQNIKTERKQ